MKSIIRVTPTSNIFVQLVLLFGLVMVNFNTLASSPALEGVDQLAWQNRVIIIHSPTPDSELHQRLINSQYDINDRDIVWFVIYNDQLITNYDGEITSRFTDNVIEIYMGSRYGVILVGKDGGIKEYQQQLDLNQLFTEIDAMPMRKREVKQASEKEFQ